MFAAIGQPPVIGEVIAGILLGPSLLGALWPAAGAFILPPSVAPSLGVVAQLGVILYMFLVGLELNPDRAARAASHATVAISHASIVVPFVLGSALALYLYPRFVDGDVPFTSFALFLGVAMSITAFPVLARILSDRGMTRTQLGVVALTCAAVDDVTAWCLLAFVVGVVQASAGSALCDRSVLTLAFIAMMFVVVRPLVRDRLVRSAGEPTDVAGRHRAHHRWRCWSRAGHRSRSASTRSSARSCLAPSFRTTAALARAGQQASRTWSTVLLLPAFFAFAGMRTEIGLVSGAAAWLVCGLIILVATRRQVRRDVRRRAVDRAGLARRGRARRADEHARPDGADRAERRPRPRRHLADAVHDDGADGAGDDDGDHAGAPHYDCPLM